MSDITITTGHYTFTIPADDREAVIAAVPQDHLRDVLAGYLNDAEPGTSVYVSLPLGDVLLDAVSTLEREREERQA